MASSGRLVLLLVASVLCVMGGEAKGLPEDKVLELLEKALVEDLKHEKRGGKFVYTCNINVCCIYGELGLLMY